VKQAAFSLHIRLRAVAASGDEQLDRSDPSVVDVTCGAIIRQRLRWHAQIGAEPA